MDWVSGIQNAINYIEAHITEEPDYTQIAKERFDKAIQTFHGISPSQARGNGVMLRSFSPLSIKESLEGGRFMNYRIEEKPGIVSFGFPLPKSNLLQAICACSGL